mmetsp:Transcript_1621/g.3560  ORF Transcript_1621/g.3560 Transcript_1621/m.3560 type:complete len:168 (-) Transcript_1621:41-544(-)
MRSRTEGFAPPSLLEGRRIDRITGGGCRVQSIRGRFGRMPMVGRLDRNDGETGLSSAIAHDNLWLFTGLSRQGTRLPRSVREDARRGDRGGRRGRDPEGVRRVRLVEERCQEGREGREAIENLELVICHKHMYRDGYICPAPAFAPSGHSILMREPPEIHIGSTADA